MYLDSTQLGNYILKEKQGSFWKIEKYSKHPKIDTLCPSLEKNGNPVFPNGHCKALPADRWTELRIKFV